MECNEDTKGKTISSEGSARRKIKPVIVILKKCCGLTKDQKYVLEAHTKGGLHYKVEERKEFVERKMRGVHWEWVTECEVPAYDPSVEADKPKPHKRKDDLRTSRSRTWRLGFDLERGCSESSGVCRASIRT